MHSESDDARTASCQTEAHKHFSGQHAERLEEALSSAEDILRVPFLSELIPVLIQGQDPSERTCRAICPSSASSEFAALGREGAPQPPTWVIAQATSR